MNTNLIVIGLGSMGKRRIRLIKDMYPQFEIAGIDFSPDRRKESEEKFHIKTYNSINEIENRRTIEYAFVCTSPLSHAAIIKECLQNNWNVFTEINLVSDGYNENTKLAEEKSKVLFLSSTYLYNDDVKFLNSIISKNNKWNYIYHIGQYLPDWHPWESYHNFFIGNKKTNGCREILAIELPWLIKVFGDIIDFHVIKDKNTNLDIDYNDNYMIQFQHINGNKGVLVVDVISPIAIRDFKAYGENKYISWNGTPDTLKVYNPEIKTVVSIDNSVDIEHIDGYADFIIENDYRNEIKEFFDVVCNNKKAIYNFNDDFNVLKLIDKLEE